VTTLPDLLPPVDVQVPLLTVSGAAGQRLGVRDALARSGAVLVRGLGLTTAADLAAAAGELTGGLLTEREGFASRDDLGTGVYSSSAWAADMPMCMHHELSYARTVPELMLFGFLTAPVSGGDFLLADGRRMLAALPAALVAPFADRGWLLTRNYYPEAGLSWQEAFGTEDRAVAEQYCRAGGITVEWRSDGVLRTRQRRAAVVVPRGQAAAVWFNQIAFLNRWTLDPDIRDYLLGEFGDRGLPFDTAYGDGQPVGADTVETINAVYEAEAIDVPWQPGDLLIVDNLRMAHSRMPYVGDRRVVVAMGDPTDRAGWDPSWPG
jgi:hypothetical protein